MDDGQITSEEMEALNRAKEILSKYAYRGSITSADLNHYDDMVIAIIDGYGLKEKNIQVVNKKENHETLQERIIGSHVKNRINNTLFIRDRIKEKTYGIDEIRLYGFYDSYKLIIVGEVFAEEINRVFCMNCIVYDKEGGILETKHNEFYGNNMIKTNGINPQMFFGGFPFKFELNGIDMPGINRIEVYPID